jgi:hypothetical protein
VNRGGVKALGGTVYGGIRLTYMAFDLLTLDGHDLTGAPHVERRAQLEALDLNGVYWQTPETFDDGQALFEAVCAYERRYEIKREPAITRPATLNRP